VKNGGKNEQWKQDRLQGGEEWDSGGKKEQFQCDKYRKGPGGYVSSGGFITD
jgi:hypothetical protein